MSKLKLCKNCKWVETNIDFKHARCMHKSAKKSSASSDIDLVTGKVTAIKSTQFYCDTWRKCYGQCGTKGKYFEPKQKSDQDQEWKDALDKTCPHLPTPKLNTETPKPNTETKKTGIIGSIFNFAKKKPKEQPEETKIIKKNIEEDTPKNAPPLFDDWE